VAEQQKLSEALGSGTADPIKGSAAAQPMPQPVVANKPAAGQRGPKGLAPRTSYSRVNTGALPAPDAGASGQKAIQPRGLEFLPSKVAHKEKISMTTMMQRPNLHDLVKEAMEGTANKINISAEAERQLDSIGDHAEQTKQASAIVDSVSTEYINKLASALDYMAKQADVATTTMQPGKGPNALEVLESNNTAPPIDVNQGKARTQIPMTPAMQSSGVASDASTAMATNDGMQHAEQPVDPMHNEGVKSAALMERNLQALGITKKASAASVVYPAMMAAGGYMGHQKGKRMHRGGEKAPEWGVGKYIGSALVHPYGAYQIGKSIGYGNSEEEAHKSKSKKKEASLHTRNLQALGLHKQAEDAINKASISAGMTQTGATPPEGASPAGEQVPSEPSDVNKQKRMISSNDAAINYTKREAKADPKKDVGHVVNEPALSASSDTTLSQAFTHTQEAGAKIASNMMRTAAAQALLSKLAACASEEAKEKGKKKEKNAQGLSTPAGQSGFQASASVPPGI